MFLLPEQGLVLPGELVIGGGQPYLHIRGPLGAFSSGVGSNRFSRDYARGKNWWFKVPASMKLHLPWTASKMDRGKGSDSAYHR